MRYHFTLVRVAIITKSINKCWQGCGEKGILVHCWWECRLVQPLGKTVWNFLRKLKMELPFDPVIPLLGLHPKNPETPIQKNLCTPMFIAAQFTIAKCWKQPKCPSAHEWLKKLFLLFKPVLCCKTATWFRSTVQILFSVSVERVCKCYKTQLFGFVKTTKFLIM